MLDHVITLIGKPEQPLAGGLAAAVRAELHRLGAETGPADWLAADIACDIGFADLNLDQAEAAARAVIGGAAIDLVAQPLAHRRKRLLLADMESTLIHNEMLDELAAFAGLRDEIALITDRAMNGELDFEAAIDARVALLKGLPETVLEDAAARIRIMEGAATLVATMRANGALAVLVSGGFTVFTDKLRRTLGLDLDFANVLLIEDGRLSGVVAKPVLGRRAKFETLLRLAADHAVPLAGTLAVGDGANDIDMIEAAGLGIAFHAKPAVAQRARHRIDHADLTALLYAQGYRRDAFVAA
jgi:phosphoserine phosphatase